MKLFETTAIKKLIDFKWPLVKYYIIRRLMIPYIVFMASYMMFAHVEYHDDNLILVPVIKYGVIAVLVLCCFYTLTSEVYQLLKNRWAYFLEIWNYLDIIPPIMVLGQLVYDFYFHVASDNTLPPSPAPLCNE